MTITAPDTVNYEPVPQIYTSAPSYPAPVYSSSDGQRIFSSEIYGKEGPSVVRTVNAPSDYKYVSPVTYSAEFN
jgi:hypothetical protein